MKQQSEYDITKLQQVREEVVKELRAAIVTKIFTKIERETREITGKNSNNTQSKLFFFPPQI